MAQERFADVVERYTSGFAADAPAEMIKKWQEELDRNVRRMRNLHGLITNPVEPKTGQTPRVDHEADGTVVFEFDQSAEITLQRFLHAKRALDRLAARGV